MKKSLVGLAFLLSFFIGLQIYACPATVLFADLFSELPKVSRNKFHLFSLSKDSSLPTWRPISLQIDPLRGDGKIKFFSPGYDHMHDFLESGDLITFETSDFGPAYNQKENYPCATGELLEVALKDNRYAYFAICEESISAPLTQPIKHDQSQREVKTRRWKYEYSAFNHLVFRRISLAYNKDGEYPLVAAEDSDQLIKANFKNLFTLEFTPKDIEAKIDAERGGPLGIVGRLSFYLNIWFLRINLKLAPLVMFYSDAIFMPMIMHIPIDPATFLTAGSGIYYTWRSGRDVIWDIENSTIPHLEGALSLHHQELAKNGLEFCKERLCHFDLRGELAQQRFMLNFNIPRSLVARGFFPMAIIDSKETTKKLNTPVSSYKDNRRMGVYFEASGLAKGDHGWDFWIRIEESAKIENERCPVEVFIDRL